MIKNFLFPWKRVAEHICLNLDKQDAITVIAVAPMGKASFVYSCIEGSWVNTIGKWPISLVYVLKLLITAIRAISGSLREKHIDYDNIIISAMAIVLLTSGIKFNDSTSFTLSVLKVMY